MLRGDTMARRLDGDAVRRLVEVLKGEPDFSCQECGAHTGDIASALQQIAILEAALVEAHAEREYDRVATPGFRWEHLIATDPGGAARRRAAARATLAGEGLVVTPH